MAATMTGIASSCRSRPGHGEGRVRSRRSEPTGGPWRELQADAHTCQLAGWGRGLHLPVGGPGPSGSGQRSWRGPTIMARANDHGAGRRLSTISEQRARGAQGPIPPASLARPMERGGDSSRRSPVGASGGWPCGGRSRPWPSGAGWPSGAAGRRTGPPGCSVMLERCRADPGAVPEPGPTAPGAGLLTAAEWLARHGSWGGQAQRPSTQDVLDQRAPRVDPAEKRVL